MKSMAKFSQNGISELSFFDRDNAAVCYEKDKRDLGEKFISGFFFSSKIFESAEKHFFHDDFCHVLLY